jgi:hypothetical protein
MTAISALGTGTTTTYRMPATGGTRAPKDRPDPLAAVAEKLGLSSDELKTRLKDGKSLDDVATAQGVPHDELIAAIKAGLPAEAASGTDATETAEKIATTKGMPPPPPGGPKGEHTGIQDPDKLSRLSELLAMDTDDVTTQAASATDLVKLLQDKGVDLNALRSVLSNGDLLDVAA